ncbi:ABC transporter ATP-binding protein [Natrarchaeobaculum aegyptiacum]|uniref:Branched-chain amino acid ABC transporter ATP-binding protein n=1 Tax=Natrarchaeobaculum aegyptiacum TaxID=745377 RepID=A0A2Z2I2I4_9EURY|nr:ABC transporter ATP-binding protein [Natrarchaeobaculum aegyptiacum]ARS91088.1 branched-chain amino acid ABC transporter ATP-binding protein [Natrarchaeobaculum aegyptiacum]
MTLIDVENLNVGYGDLQVLWDVSMTVEEDESVIAIVGPNGAGKTTLLKTLSGLLEPTSGTIEIFGEDTSEYSPEEIIEHGFVQVPEERNLFDDMSVYDNLRMGSYRHREQFEETREEVVNMFPVLEERRNQHAGTLSGGEQQMLAIGRGLMAQPKMLAFDEPSGALAPQLAERVFEKIEEISDDIPVLLVEQHVDRALELADRAYLLENGRIVTEGTGDDLLESDHVREAYLRG